MIRSTLPVAIGLGANLGDRLAAMHEAGRRLTAGGLGAAQLSPLFETAPVDCVPGTPPFINAVVLGQWSGSPIRLWRLCRQIERELGRPGRHSKREARVIDLDILLIGDRVVANRNLTVPHPHLLARRFVLEPLACLTPEWRFAGAGLTVAEALARLDKDPSAGLFRRLPDG